MATLVSDIIKDAYRESNLISIGTEPSGAQKEEALRFINRVLPSVYGNEQSELFVTELSESLYQGYVQPNIRVYLNKTDGRTIYLPRNPRDGARFAFVDTMKNLSEFPLLLQGSGNNIEGQAAQVYSESGLSKEFFFRADLGDWKTTSPLSENDLWPFPPEFDDMFIIILAFRLNPRYNISSAPESMAMLKRTTGQFKSRYAQRSQVPSEVWFVTPDERTGSIGRQDFEQGFRPLSSYYGIDPWQ